MKKVFLVATAAFLVTGMAFAHDGAGKKCGNGKDCCKGKTECKDMKKEEKKETKTTAKATTVKVKAKA